jgi:hypothetical protein
MRRILGAALACATLSGCLVEQRLRPPTDPGHGAIVMALSFKGREMPYWRRHLAQELFFRRELPDGTLEPVLIPANYRAHDRLYALDLPPGVYRLVAASYFTGRSRQFVKLEREQTKDWTVAVKPGRLTFAGIGLLPRTGQGLGPFVLNGLRRAASYLPPFRRAVIKVQIGLPRLDRSTSAELETLRLARVDLSGTRWGELVSDRLHELGNPPDPITEGLVFRKAVPHERASTFSYIDTLEWGPPRPVPGGLEWRRPKTPAAISVALVPVSGDGARPLERMLAELREAGAPEDTHTLSQISVSTRPAYSALYTSYVYRDTELVGSDVRVVKTQEILVPDARGVYRLRYRAEASLFERHLPAFERFIRYLQLYPPGVPEKT